MTDFEDDFDAFQGTAEHKVSRNEQKNTKTNNQAPYPSYENDIRNDSELPHEIEGQKNNNFTDQGKDQNNANGDWEDFGEFESKPPSFQVENQSALTFSSQENQIPQQQHSEQVKNTVNTNEIEIDEDWDTFGDEENESKGDFVIDAQRYHRSNFAPSSQLRNQQDFDSVQDEFVEAENENDFEQFESFNDGDINDTNENQFAKKIPDSQQDSSNEWENSGCFVDQKGVDQTEEQQGTNQQEALDASEDDFGEFDQSQKSEQEDDFGDFDQGDKNPHSDVIPKQEQQQQNVEGEEDFGDFNEGGETYPPANYNFPQNQEQSEEDEFGDFDEGGKPPSPNNYNIQQENSENLEDDDFGDFNEGEETEKIHQQNEVDQIQSDSSQSQSQQAKQQFQQQQQQTGQIDLINIEGSQYEAAIQHIFLAAFKNLEFAYKQIDQISSDQFPQLIISECQENIWKNIEYYLSVNSQQQQQQQQQQQIKQSDFNYRNSSSENRFLQTLGLVDLAKRSQELENQQNILKAQQKLRQRSWQVAPNLRRISKNKVVRNMKSEYSVSQQKREQLNSDPFAASGPVANLDLDESATSLDLSPTSKSETLPVSPEDDPFSFVFSNQQLQGEKVIKQETAVGADVSSLDDFLSFPVADGPTAETPTKNTKTDYDPFQSFEEDALAMDNQENDIHEPDGFGEPTDGRNTFGVGSAPALQSQTNEGKDKQAILEKILEKLPDLSYMLARDVQIRKSPPK
eukprot:TRINITY_DN9051_c1_g1_i3.p2 TRINITY_DN9051_c1_g1~~TRINITY_DN9051_c1_g1_i3.p2  ORF type:complete len:741 (-),score=157.60 TRINITY_DN9051_c1_g1_i3:363-2585(-)